MRLARYAAIACCIAGSVSILGCQSDNQKESAKKIEMEDKMMSPTVNNTNKTIADGQAMKQKGMALKQQGATAEGDKMIADGDKMINDANMMKQKELAK